MDQGMINKSNITSLSKTLKSGKDQSPISIIETDEDTTTKSFINHKDTIIDDGHVDSICERRKTLI